MAAASWFGLWLGVSTVLTQVSEFDRIQRGARLEGSTAQAQRDANDKASDKAIVAQLESELDVKRDTFAERDLKYKLARLPATTRKRALEAHDKRWRQRELWLKGHGASRALVDAERVRSQAQAVEEAQRGKAK